MEMEEHSLTLKTTNMKNLSGYTNKGLYILFRLLQRNF